MEPENPLDSSVLFRLLLIVNLTAKPFARRYEAVHRLRLNDWRTLHAVALRPGVSAADVAFMLGLDKMAISRSVRALEAMGRLDRRGSERDGRKNALHLTPDGQALHDMIAVSGAAREARLMEGLSRAEQQMLSLLVDKVVAQARALADDD